jgi:hypothetical protein
MEKSASEKAATFLKKLRNSEANLKPRAKDWPAGCVYKKWDETRIGPGGQLQKRTCREVTGCEDSAYNHPKICEEWQDM